MLQIFLKQSFWEQKSGVSGRKASEKKAKKRKKWEAGAKSGRRPDPAGEEPAVDLKLPGGVSPCLPPRTLHAQGRHTEDITAGPPTNTPPPQREARRAAVQVQLRAEPVVAPNRSFNEQIPRRSFTGRGKPSLAALAPMSDPTKRAARWGKRKENEEGEDRESGQWTREKSVEMEWL